MPTIRPVDVTPDELLALAKELQRTAVALQVRAESVKEDGLERLTVTSHDQLLRGLQFIERFVGALRKSHLEAMQKAGKYGVRQKDTTDPNSNPEHNETAQ